MGVFYIYLYMILDREKLLRDGYLTFNIKEVDLDLYNRLYSNFQDQTYSNKNWSLRYETTIIHESEKKLRETILDYFKELNINDNHNFSIDKKNETSKIDSHMVRMFIHEYDLNTLKSLQKKLDKFTTNKNGQSWYYKNKCPFSTELIKELFNKTIINELYNEDIIDKDKYSKFYGIYQDTDFTLYIKNNYIETHQDAEDKGRLAVFLMYLSDDYKDGYGGEIVVNNEKTVTPEFGNIVILDFTKNNLQHEVMPVLDENFHRYAIINFLYQ